VTYGTYEADGINASWLGEKSLTVGVDEVRVGELNRGGVGGQGLLQDTTDSFPPSKKLEESLVGVPGCGSSAVAAGAVKLLTGAACLPVLRGRTGNMDVERRTKNGRTVGVAVMESGYKSMIAQVSTASTL
jgi:hypothetical protein